MKRLWTTKLPAFLLAMVMVIGMIPAAAAASADISYDVDAGSYVTIDISDFSDYFDDEATSRSESLYRVQFTRADAFDDYGYFYAYDEDNNRTELDYDELLDGIFYVDEDDVTDSDEYELSGLRFYAYKNADSDTLSFTFKCRGDEGSTYTGYLEIDIDGGSSSSTTGDIVVEVDADDDIALGSKKFKSYFDKKSLEDFDHIYFYKVPSGLDKYGYFSSRNKNNKTVAIDEDDLDDAYFYYDDDDVTGSDEYTLDDLTFTAEDDMGGKSVSLTFYAVGHKGDEVKGTLTIKIKKTSGSSSGSSTTTKKGDINYKVDPDDEVEFDADDFNDFFQETYSRYDLEYVYFTDVDDLSSDTGYVYYKYDSKSEVKFKASTLEDAYFYYDEDEMPDDDDCYPLDDLSFVASDDFDSSVTLEFTAYYSSSKKVSGTLVITSTKSNAISAISGSGVRYYTTGSNAVQINANDIARAYTKQYPGSTLQSVDILSVPATGSLYYDYYGSSRTQLTSKNCSSQSFYRSPSGSQYDLNRLTYIPSGTNYCDYILYTAKGTSGSVLGSILISVTKSAVGEVYGITPKNTAVPFSTFASYLYSTVYTATGISLDSIQLLELPAATVGTVSLSDGYLSLKADTTTKYTYSGTSTPMSQLKFTPATNYTGSVEIPYLALDRNGTAIAAGKFCLGVLNSRKTFSDISSSTWCYKYVTELSDTSVIDGYSDGTFKEKNAITYGAALKLVMLAAGYPEQPKTGTHVFSGYLSRAQADGLVSGNVDLSKPITRLQVSQLAAKALKLDIYNLSSVKPFTDTTDPYVQALNAAGIVEGYFANGTSTFKPNNTLTRGQVSAIVWRMRNYNK